MAGSIALDVLARSAAALDGEALRVWSVMVAAAHADGTAALTHADIAAKLGYSDARRPVSRVIDSGGAERVRFDGSRITYRVLIPRAARALGDAEGRLGADLFARGAPMSGLQEMETASAGHPGADFSAPTPPHHAPTGAVSGPIMTGTRSAEGAPAGAGLPPDCAGGRTPPAPTGAVSPLSGPPQTPPSEHIANGSHHHHPKTAPAGASSQTAPTGAPSHDDDAMSSGGSGGSGGGKARAERALSQAERTPEMLAAIAALRAAGIDTERDAIRYVRAIGVDAALAAAWEHKRAREEARVAGSRLPGGGVLVLRLRALEEDATLRPALIARHEFATLKKRSALRIAAPAPAGDADAAKAQARMGVLASAWMQAAPAARWRDMETVLMMDAPNEFLRRRLERVQPVNRRTSSAWHSALTGWLHNNPQFVTDAERMVKETGR